MKGGGGGVYITLDIHILDHKNHLHVFLGQYQLGQSDDSFEVTQTFAQTLLVTIIRLRPSIHNYYNH